jgi:hypothetical protein|tara:strand:- start:2964 stop:3140 length:177 start_codon:yes stop_codon:yes gene_type:complete
MHGVMQASPLAARTVRVRRTPVSKIALFVGERSFIDFSLADRRSENAQTGLVRGCIAG